MMILCYRDASCKKLTWRIDKISRDSEGQGLGSLRAKFTSNDSMANLNAVLIQFQSECSLSGMHFELVGAGYRLSLLKNHLIAGKFWAHSSKRKDFLIRECPIPCSTCYTCMVKLGGRDSSNSWQLLLTHHIKPLSFLIDSLWCSLSCICSRSLRQWAWKSFLISNYQSSECYSLTTLDSVICLYELHSHSNRGMLLKQVLDWAQGFTHFNSILRNMDWIDLRFLPYEIWLPTQITILLHIPSFNAGLSRLKTLHHWVIDPPQSKFFWEKFGPIIYWTSQQDVSQFFHTFMLYFSFEGLTIMITRFYAMYLLLIWVEIFTSDFTKIWLKSLPPKSLRKLYNIAFLHWTTIEPNSEKDFY